MAAPAAALSTAPPVHARHRRCVRLTLWVGQPLRLPRTRRRQNCRRGWREAPVDPPHGLAACVECRHVGGLTSERGIETRWRRIPRRRHPRHTRPSRPPRPRYPAKQGHGSAIAGRFGLGAVPGPVHVLGGAIGGGRQAVGRGQQPQLRHRRVGAASGGVGRPGLGRSFRGTCLGRNPPGSRPGRSLRAPSVSLWSQNLRTRTLLIACDSGVPSLRTCNPFLRRLAPCGQGRRSLHPSRSQRFHARIPRCFGGGGAARLLQRQTARIVCPTLRLLRTLLCRALGCHRRPRLGLHLHPPPAVPRGGGCTIRVGGEAYRQGARDAATGAQGRPDAERTRGRQKVAPCMRRHAALRPPIATRRTLTPAPCLSIPARRAPLRRPHTRRTGV
eukprot:scaffold7936_cov116-Isochrysis_galbana.AAC.11